MGWLATIVRPACLFSSLFRRKAGEASAVVFVVVGRASRQRGYISEWLFLRLLVVVEFISRRGLSLVLDDGLGALRGGCDPGVVRFLGCNLRHISLVFRSLPYRYRDELSLNSCFSLSFPR